MLASYILKLYTIILQGGREHQLHRLKRASLDPFMGVSQHAQPDGDRQLAYRQTKNKQTKMSVLLYTAREHQLLLV